MLPSSAKRKGKSLQNWVCQQLRSLFDLSADDVRSCSMGAQGEDVQLSAAARAAIGFSIECKSRAAIAVYAWLAQGKSDHPPLVIAKANGKRPIAILYADDLFRLMQPPA